MGLDRLIENLSGQLQFIELEKLSLLQYPQSKYFYSVQMVASPRYQL